MVTVESEADTLAEAEAQAEANLQAEAAAGGGILDTGPRTENPMDPNDSAYSNSTNSKSRRSRSSKSTNSGSNYSGSSGYGGKPTDSNSTSNSSFPAKPRGKRHRKKKIDAPSQPSIAEELLLPPPSPPGPSGVCSEPPVKIAKISVDDVEPSSSESPIDHELERRSEKVKSLAPDVTPLDEDQVLSSVINLTELVDTILELPSATGVEAFWCMISMKDGVVMFTTPSLTNMLHFPKDMWLGRSFIDFVHPWDKDSFSQQISMATKQVELINGACHGSLKIDQSMFCRIRCYRSLAGGFSVKTRDIVYKPFRLKMKFKNVEDDNGCNIYLVIKATKFESYYSIPYQIVKNASFFVIRHTAKGQIDSLGAEAVPFMGFFPQDLYGKDVLELYHTEDMQYIKEIYETILKDGGMPKCRPFRMQVHNGDYIKLQTEWSSFINPWSKKLEFIIGKHYIVEGPKNPNVFETPKVSKMQKFNDFQKRTASSLRIDIIKMMADKLLNPVNDERVSMAKRCQYLASYMENIIRDQCYDADSQYNGRDTANYYEGESILLGGLSPHFDRLDDESSSKTPLSYTQLNYNENLVRYFDNYEPEKLTPPKTEPSMATSNNENQMEVSSPSGSPTLIRNDRPGLVTNDANGMELVAMDEIGEIGVVVEKSDHPECPRLTESLITKHNQNMEKQLINKHRDARNQKRPDNFFYIKSLIMQAKLARCNAALEHAGISINEDPKVLFGQSPHGTKRLGHDIFGGPNKLHCVTPGQIRPHMTNGNVDQPAVGMAEPRFSHPMTVVTPVPGTSSYYHTGLVPFFYINPINCSTTPVNLGINSMHLRQASSTRMGHMNTIQMLPTNPLNMVRMPMHMGPPNDINMGQTSSMDIGGQAIPMQVAPTNPNNIAQTPSMNIGPANAMNMGQTPLNHIEPTNAMNVGQTALMNVEPTNQMDLARGSAIPIAPTNPMNMGQTSLMHTGSTNPINVVRPPVIHMSPTNPMNMRKTSSMYLGLPNPMMHVGPTNVMDMGQTSSMPTNPMSAIPPRPMSAMAPGPISALPQGPTSAMPPRPSSAKAPGPMPAMPSGPTSAIAAGPTPAMAPELSSAMPPGPFTAMPPGPSTAIPLGPTSAIPTGPTSAIPSPTPAIPLCPTSAMDPGPIPIMPSGPTTMMPLGPISLMLQGALAVIPPNPKTALPLGPITDMLQDSTAMPQELPAMPQGLPAMPPSRTALPSVPTPVMPPGLNCAMAPGLTSARPLVPNSARSSTKLSIPTSATASGPTSALPPAPNSSIEMQIGHLPYMPMETSSYMNSSSTLPPVSSPSMSPMSGMVMDSMRYMHVNPSSAIPKDSPPSMPTGPSPAMEMGSMHHMSTNPSSTTAKDSSPSTPIDPTPASNIPRAPLQYIAMNPSSSMDKGSASAMNMSSLPYMAPNPSSSMPTKSSSSKPVSSSSEMTSGSSIQMGKNATFSTSTLPYMVYPHRAMYGPQLTFPSPPQPQPPTNTLPFPVPDSLVQQTTFKNSIMNFGIRRRGTLSTLSSKLSSKNSAETTKVQNLKEIVSRNSDEVEEKLDNSSSTFSSLNSSFFKSDNGWSAGENSPNDEINKAKHQSPNSTSLNSCSSDEKNFTDYRDQSKRCPKPIGEPSCMEKVNLTSDLIYKYQVATRDTEEVLAEDKEKISRLTQPPLVSDQLSQLYLDLQLQGVAAKLTLEEGITSSGSSGEDNNKKTLLNTPKNALRRNREYTKLAMIYEEDALMPSPDEDTA